MVGLCFSGTETAVNMGEAPSYGATFLRGDYEGIHTVYAFPFVGARSSSAWGWQAVWQSEAQRRRLFSARVPPDLDYYVTDSIILFSKRNPPGGTNPSQWGRVVRLCG